MNMYQVAEREAEFAQEMKHRAVRAEAELETIRTELAAAQAAQQAAERKLDQWRAATEDLIKGLRKECTQLCECEVCEGGEPCGDVATLVALHWTCDAHRVVHEGDFFGPRDMEYAAALRKLRELVGLAP